MKLVAEWLSDLRRNLTAEPLVSDVRVGVFYTAVEISTGDVGVAFTPRDLSDTVCCPKTAEGAAPAGRLIGVKAWELAQYALSPSALRRAVGIATLNALSAATIERCGLWVGTLKKKLDALDAAAIVPGDRVVMVGAFVPFIKRLKGRVAGISVIDKHRDALKPDEQSLWISPQLAVDALRNANVVIFSGSALVESGIEELLQASRSARILVMAGPTTPLWPRPFFERGIAVLGGIQVISGKDLITIVGQGGSGYLFGRAAEKACIINPSLNLSAQRNALPSGWRPLATR